MNKFLENLKPSTIKTLNKIIVEGGHLKSLEELSDDNIEEVFINEVIIKNEVGFANAKEKGEPIDEAWLKEVTDAVTDFTQSDEWYACCERLEKKSIYL